MTTTLDRFAARSRSDRRRRCIKIAVAVVAVVAVGALVWLIWFSTVLAVRDVEVAGRTTLKESQVLRAAAVPLGKPLARADLTAIEGRVASLERVDSVEVSRSWPHTVSIDVVEREAVLWATVGGQVRGIDREGVDYRSYRTAPKNLVEATISITDAADRLKVARSLAEVVELITDQDPALRKDLVAITAGTQDSIELSLTDNRTIVWGNGDDGERKITVLKALLGIKAARYDVSAPDQPTTKE